MISIYDFASRSPGAEFSGFEELGSLDWGASLDDELSVLEEDGALWDGEEDSLPCCELAELGVTVTEQPASIAAASSEAVSMIATSIKVVFFISFNAFLLFQYVGIGQATLSEICPICARRLDYGALSSSI